MKNSPRREGSPTPRPSRSTNGPQAAENVDGAVAKGAAWMIFARLGDRGVGLVSTLILVRLLVPADFGLVAMGMSVVAVCELIGQLGLDAALIQNPNATRRHYDTAWAFTIILAVVIAVALLFLAFPAARFYGEPRLAPILLALALGSLISGFENIGIVKFRKDLQFNKDFYFSFSKKLAGFVVTVPLAFFFGSYWALIAGIIISRLAGVCLSYYMQEYRPRWSLAARKELFHFSKWMFVYSSCNVVNNRVADLIVGKIAGAHALGVFNVSYEISNLPTSDLIAPINRAVFPGYARKSEDRAVLRQGYLDVIGMIAACAVPTGVGIAATSNWIVPLFLGVKWTEAIPLIAVLAVYGVLFAMSTNAYYVYFALGKPNIATYLTVIQTSLLLPSLVLLTIRFGTIGAAYGYLIGQAIFAPISFSVLFKVLDITAGHILRVLWRPVISAAFMIAIVRVLAAALPPDPQGNFMLLQYFLLAAVCGAVSYVSCLYTLWMLSAKPVGAESRILGTVQSTRFWLRLKSCQS